MGPDQLADDAYRQMLGTNVSRTLIADQVWRSVAHTMINCGVDVKAAGNSPADLPDSHLGEGSSVT
jgi:hypothetical protein